MCDWESERYRERESTNKWGEWDSKLIAVIFTCFPLLAKPANEQTWPPAVSIKHKHTLMHSERFQTMPVDFIMTPNNDHTTADAKGTNATLWHAPKTLPAVCSTLGLCGVFHLFFIYFLSPCVETWKESLHTHTDVHTRILIHTYTHRSLEYEASMTGTVEISKVGV